MASCFEVYCNIFHSLINEWTDVINDWNCLSYPRDPMYRHILEFAQEVQICIFPAREMVPNIWRKSLLIFLGKKVAIVSQGHLNKSISDLYTT